MTSKQHAHTFDTTIEWNLSPWASNRPYLKPKFHANVISHRPKSTCDSPYYTYVQSPLCDAIVERLPPWLAPNLITIWGFGWNVLVLLIMLYLYGNSMDGYFDPRLAFFAGICYFLFQTADNCDGKQARKNGTGSVMGMLFDHGLDATTGILVNVILARMLNVGSGVPALLVIQVSTVSYYFLMLEEYYIGLLHLPMFIGPDDVSLYISGLCFLCAYKGSGDWWTEMIDAPFGLDQLLGVPSLKRSTLVVLFFYVLEVFGYMFGSGFKYWMARNEEHFKERFTVTSFSMHVGYMVLLMLIYDIYGIFCGSDILETHPRSVVFCFAGQHLQATLRLIVS